MMPTVSIIVPVYNLASYLRECIESIQKQTYQMLEIIIVDDGSEDGSSELSDEIAAKDSRVTVIHQKNAGVVVARSKGIEAANGKYISFVDGDDWIEPDMVECLIEKIGDADIITTGVKRELTPNRWIEECDKFPEGLYSGEEVSAILEKMVYDFDNDFAQPLIPGMCNKLYLYNLVKKVYKEINAEISYEEDAVFTYKCLLQCHSIVVSHQCYYHYRYRKGSAIHSVNNHILENINKVYFNLETDFGKHRLRNSLLLQLQRWIMFMSCRAINDFMGFDTRVCIPEYIANLSYLEDKKLILYGAGRAGQDTYAQMRHHGYHVMLWADKNYKEYQEKGLLIDSPEKIADINYEQIFIAVGDEVLAEEIKKDLLQRGVSEEALIWRKPMRIF